MAMRSLPRSSTAASQLAPSVDMLYSYVLRTISVSTLAEAPGWLDWLFVDSIDEYDEKAWTKAIVKGRAADRVLDEIAAALADDDFTDRDRLEATVMGIGNRLSEELDARVMSQAPLRIALTGRGAGIPLWEAMTHLGRDACLARIAGARARIDA